MALSNLVDPLSANDPAAEGDDGEVKDCTRNLPRTNYNNIASVAVSNHTNSILIHINSVFMVDGH